ncbi:MAG: hypothetical protein R2695_08955 [Acidimicrobiales bacterium]
MPLELRASEADVGIEDGVLTINWDWDFAAHPIDNFSTSNVSGRYLDQIAANAFQFDEIDAIDLDVLCCGDWEGLYTRDQWEQVQADE